MAENQPKFLAAMLFGWAAIPTDVYPGRAVIATELAFGSIISVCTDSADALIANDKHTIPTRRQ